MNNNQHELELIAELPVRSDLTVEKSSRYGSVPGLDDDELADPAELERCIFLRDFEPVLRLPAPPKRDGIRPTIEDGRVDWGAFGTVDWERIAGPFNKARYRAERLSEELQNTLFLLGTAKEKVPAEKRSLAIKEIREGRCTFSDIEDADIRDFTRLYLRANRQRAELLRVREAASRRPTPIRAFWLD